MEGSRWEAAGRRRGRAEIRQKGKGTGGAEGAAEGPPDGPGNWKPDASYHAAQRVTAGVIQSKMPPRARKPSL